MRKNSKNKYEREYNKYKQKVELQLNKICDGLHNMPHILVDAIKYSVLGGKRIRAVLCLSTIKMLGGIMNERATQLASIIELIHCYSLVHDDLPCMDDDAMRRNKPSTHKQYGEAIGVLAGDAILNLAYEIGFSIVNSNKGMARALECVAANAGGLGMIGGQVEDVLIDEKRDTSKLEYIYLCKTAAMFCASFVSVGRLLGVKNNIIEQLDIFGRAFGVAFQIKDDLDEYYNGGGSDKSQAKVTVISVYGDVKATELLKEHIDKATEVLKTLEGEGYCVEFLMETLHNIMK